MKHYVASIDALGTGNDPDAYRATVQISEHVSLVAVDTSPFWAMCEMIKALKDLGASGTVEGFYGGDPVLDPISGNGLPLNR